MSGTEGPKEDEHFVELFKKEHNEQFYVLVKMHLSFLLHMTTEESECFYEKVKLRRWNLNPFGKKPKQKHLNDGAIVNEDVLGQLHQLIGYLKVDNSLETDGIFRKTGSLERQNELRNMLQQGCTINFQENQFTVHDAASVLKGILADMPEPLITEIQFPIYCQIAEYLRLDETCHETKILQSIQLLNLLLPKETKLLLHDIFELLHLVALHEDSNRMSSENLAKLFTPHLLCPRKLAPETLLKNSQVLFGTVAFMIKNYPSLFKVPAQLMLDFKSHYEQGGVLNESVKGAAHTVFTFVDNKLTAKENEENVTDAALAELYAHIQSMPESSKKRKLVKQFNKQNGQGTPLQVLRSSVPKNKSLGDSIKKHMFHNKLLKNVKRSGAMQLKSSSSEEMLNSPHLSQKPSSRGRLFCHNYDSSTDDEDKPAKRLKNSQGSPVEPPRRRSDSDLSLGNSSELACQYLTSTPACILNRVDDAFTPKAQNRRSMSPITRSAQRMPRAMQETMMTPRSRKPVLLVSGTNINNLAKVSPTLTNLQEEDNPTILGQEDSPFPPKNAAPKPFTKSKSDGELHGDPKHSALKLNKTDSPMTLSTTFKEYLSSRDMLTFESSPRDSTFSSRSDDFQSFSALSDGLKDNEDIYFNTQIGIDEKMTDSLLYVLDGNSPSELSKEDSMGEKKLVLKPRQFDENGKPIVFETSF